jgi:hypothetical protein
MTGLQYNISYVMATSASGTAKSLEGSTGVLDCSVNLNVEVKQGNNSKNSDLPARKP